MSTLYGRKEGGGAHVRAPRQEPQAQRVGQLRVPRGDETPRRLPPQQLRDLRTNLRQVVVEQRLLPQNISQLNGAPAMRRTRCRGAPRRAGSRSRVCGWSEGV